MASIGYARVSSVGQSLDVQLDKLKNCRKVFQEKKSAAGGKRPALQACLEYFREGDTLVVTRLDRLARSTLHLCQIADELKRKEVELLVIDQNINTADATGRLLLICWEQSTSLKRKSEPNVRLTVSTKLNKRASNSERQKS